MGELSERQKEITGAALSIISEKGIQELTTKNLSKRLKISEPALYRHFRNKIDILVTILSEYKITMEAIAEEVRQSDLEPMEKIGNFFRAVFTRFHETPSLTSVIFAEEIFRNEKKLSKAVLEIMRFAHIQVIALVEQGQKQKHIRADIPKEHMVYLLMGMHRLLVTRWRMSDFSFNLLDEHAAVWKTFRKLYLPELKK